MDLRPYQLDALEAINADFREYTSTLLVLPTGCGKTIVFAHLGDQDRIHGRIMVIAHREELINQAAEKIKAVSGITPDIEMAEQHADSSLFSRSPIVISTVQTLTNGPADNCRLLKFDPFQFSRLIIDEAHHAPANSYRRIFKHFTQNEELKVLGVTATPDRKDQAAMGKVFESVAYEYAIPDAIRDGWLVPVKQIAVDVASLDLRAVRTTAGDLNGADLAKIMEIEETLHGVADPTIEIAGDKKCLVFTASLVQAERLCEIFNRHEPMSARWIQGNTPKDQRRAILADFKARKFKRLVNVGVFTEGFDDPSIEAVVMARPTKSRALYAQMAGRGTRPLPGVVDGLADAEARRQAIAESGKPGIEIIDFVGNADKHKLVTTADILGGRDPDEVIERAKAKAEKSKGEPVDMLEALEESRKELEREAEERKRRLHIKAKAKYSRRDVDPFDVLDIKPPREVSWHQGRELSPKQKNVLRKAGFDDKQIDGFTYCQGKRLVTEVFERWDSGKCSFKQARILKKYGINAEVSFREASAMIDAIKANGWKGLPKREGVSA